jgi:protein tyrosine phosphatase (PTP) superfamily phosphohydrolase (DUF442 family)
VEKARSNLFVMEVTKDPFTFLFASVHKNQLLFGYVVVNIPKHLLIVMVKIDNYLLIHHLGTHESLQFSIDPTKISNTVFAAPALDATGLYKASLNGVKHVYQLCASDEEAFRKLDPNIVKAMGMEFHHFPTQHGVALDQQIVEKFLEETKTIQGGGILLCCASGRRATELGKALAKSRGEISDE